MQKKILQDILNPLVIKPAYRTGSLYLITTGILADFELFKAILLPSQYCPKLLDEEQISGNSYCLYYKWIIIRCDKTPSSVSFGRL